MENVPLSAWISYVCFRQRTKNELNHGMKAHWLNKSKTDVATACMAVNITDDLNVCFLSNVLALL